MVFLSDKSNIWENKCRNSDKSTVRTFPRGYCTVDNGRCHGNDYAGVATTTTDFLRWFRQIFVNVCDEKQLHEHYDDIAKLSVLAF